MEAKSLMIGDWVFIDETADKVESIYEHSYRYRVNDDRYDVEYCKPIPLTEEILNANGFEPLQKMWYIKGTFIGVDWNEKEIKECRFGEDVLYFGHTKHKIRYVHELQHALRLCGLNELADNFKLN